MANHDVSFKIPQKVVLAKDIELEIKSDGAMLGRLLISKGNVEWIPGGNVTNKYRLSWEKFALLMQAEGNVAKIKK
jgi:hypothetical protein